MSLATPVHLLLTMALVLPLLLFADLAAAAVDDTEFPDVSASHPYAEAIYELASRGIISGYADGRFGPDDPVMRQQSAKMIVLSLGLEPAPAGYPLPFTDIGADWPYPTGFVAIAYQRNITTGVTPVTFAPWDSITRAQVITMVVRAVENINPALLATPPVGVWSGWGNFDPIHGPTAAKAQHNGLLEGLPVESLSAWSAMPRGEVAQVLGNLIAKAAAALMSNPFWAVADSGTPQWRWDSRVGEPTVGLTAGTALVYRALVRDWFGNPLRSTDVSAFHPKMIGLHTPPGSVVPVVRPWDPDDYVTDADGFLLWTQGGMGHWGGVVPGTVGEVSFWLDFDNDGTIDAGAETDSNVPGWGTPWARWEFTAG